MPPPKPRTLSTAEDRREDVLRAAVPVFAARGIHGTPTMEVAKAAGISQAYLFRLFPTKEDLAVAVLRRNNELIHETLLAAAKRAADNGDELMPAMGAAYVELLQDRDLLLCQLHAQAASVSVPAIRDVTRDAFRDLVEMVERETHAEPLEVLRFFAKGMLLNTLAAMDVVELGEPWSELLLHGETPATS